MLDQALNLGLNVNSNHKTQRIKCKVCGEARLGAKGGVLKAGALVGGGGGRGEGGCAQSPHRRALPHLPRVK